METCKICGKEFQNNNNLGIHILKTHKMSTQEYYDQYLKENPNEGFCERCGKPTKFKTMVKGYNQFCSHACCNTTRWENETEEEKQARVKKSAIGYKRYRTNMTKEEREKDHISHVNAQKYRSQESKEATSQKLKDICANRTEAQKEQMYQKMVETRNNRPEELKQQERDKKLKALRDRWDNITEEEREQFIQNCKNTYHAQTEQHIDQINDKRRESRVQFMKNKPSFNGIYFDSGWEYNVYKYCIEHDIPIKREPVSIRYTHNGKNLTAYPDFEIDGRLVELKGKQFVKKDGSWKNPFAEEDDGSTEAKHQALLKANVLIWYEPQVKAFLKGDLSVLYN